MKFSLWLYFRLLHYIGFFLLRIYCICIVILEIILLLVLFILLNIRTLTSLTFELIFTHITIFTQSICKKFINIDSFLFIKYVPYGFSICCVKSNSSIRFFDIQCEFIFFKCYWISNILNICKSLWPFKKCIRSGCCKLFFFSILLFFSWV